MAKRVASFFIHTAFNMPPKSRSNRRKKNKKHAPIVEEVTEPEWLLKNASRAGEVLRKLHLRGDERRFDFVVSLEDFLGEEPNEDQIHEIFEGRLPQVLMDISTDKTLYKQFPDDDEIAFYVTTIHEVLSTLIRHTVMDGCHHDGHIAGKHHPWARYLLQQYPHFWSLIAEFPELIEYDGLLPGDDGFDDDEDVSDDSNYRDGLTNLAMAYNFLSMKEDRRMPTLSDGQGAYVAMLVWLHSVGPHCRDHLMVAQATYFSCASESAIVTYLDQVLARGTVTPGDYLDRCCAALYEEDVLNDCLWALLTTMGNLFRHTRFRKARGQEDELPFIILYAAQRQICSGDDHTLYRVLQATFNQIGNMFSDDRTIMLLRDSPKFSHYLILLLARALVPAAQADDVEDVEGMFTVFTVHARTFQALEGDDFRADVRRVWHRTCEELITLSPSVAHRRTQMIDLWTELGKKCGVDVDVPYDPNAEFEPSGSRSRGKRCAWRECLCFEDRPSHRMKLCKRCAKVFYCSAKCQTRDWNEGGHRRACQPPSS